MIVKGLRNGLGQLIIFADWLTRPKGQKRSAEKQAEVDGSGRCDCTLSFISV